MTGWDDGDLVGPADPAGHGGDDRDVDDVDQVSSAPPLQRPRVVAGSVAAVLVALAVVAAIVGRSPHHHTAAPVLPLPTVPAPVTGPTQRPVEQGSVFLEHLGSCTTTDHRTRLTVAVAVTNLSHRVIEVVGAEPLYIVPGVSLVRVRFGAAPCGAGGSASSVSLAPARAVVVALSYRVGPTCPDETLLATRLTFRAGAEQLHADSSELANLRAVRFQQCRG